MIRQVLREGARLAAVGTMVGIGGSHLLAQKLSQITSTAAPPPFWVWMAGPLLVAVAVALAGVLPARRALMIDPLRILRNNH